MATYRTSFSIMGAESASERVSFENPVGSGKKALMHMPLRTVADQGFSIFKIRRRDALASKIGAQDAPVYKQDSADSAAVCAPYFDEDSTQLTFNGSVDWERLTSHDASDGGDDSEEFPTKYIGNEHALVIRPGESMTLVLPDGEIEWNVEILWEELPE